MDNHCQHGLTVEHCTFCQYEEIVRLRSELDIKILENVKGAQVLSNVEEELSRLREELEIVRDERDHYKDKLSDHDSAAQAHKENAQFMAQRWEETREDLERYENMLANCTKKYVLLEAELANERKALELACTEIKKMYGVPLYSTLAEDPDYFRQKAREAK